MKKLLLSALLITLIIIACKTSGKQGLLLQKPGDVPADEYVINTDRDTTLLTKNGALLKIPKGALQSGSTSVTLEIKEAYTAEQMIRSGLTTQSDGELLSSGGMIYINAKGGQEVKITQAIKVALPTGNLDSSMKLFKGEPDADGNINWKDPVALSENPQLASVNNGKALFMSKCAACHSIGKTMTGPDLGHYLKRFSGDTLLVRGYSLHIPYWPEEGDYYYRDSSIGHKSLHDKLAHISSDLWRNQWLYFCNQKSQYGSLGTQFPNLSEQDLTSIYQYIQSESEKRGLSIPEEDIFTDCIDSCLAYKKLKAELESQKVDALDRKDDLYKNRENMTKEERHIDTNNNPQTGTGAPVNNLPPSTAPAPQTVEWDKVVNPDNKESLYYQFSIETFGWYNVDVLVKEFEGSVKSDLFVRVTGEYKTKADVFLIIPSNKVYTKAGKKEGSEDQLVFAYKDGSIYLPQGAQAYILAVSESESSVAFSLKQFTTELKQEFDIELKSASKEEFSEAIKSLNTSGINIMVKDAQHADEIRKMDREIKNIDSALKNAEQLKPKNCDCDCGSDYNVMARTAPDTAKKVEMVINTPK